jgi:hypothetical protein
MARQPRFQYPGALYHPPSQHGEKEALWIIKEGCQALGLPPNAIGLGMLKKTDPLKIQLAILLHSHTSVSNVWIADHLGSVRRSVSVGRATKEIIKNSQNLGRMLRCVIWPH